MHPNSTSFLPKATPIKSSFPLFISSITYLLNGLNIKLSSIAFDSSQMTIRVGEACLNVYSNYLNLTTAMLCLHAVSNIL